MNRRAVLYALISAALFGLSTPAAKVLLDSISPALLAGLLYLGAGTGVAILRRALRGTVGGKSREAALTVAEMPWLVAAVIAGGIVGPVLLMFGLARIDASTASLLLTLESAATALLAWFIFHENFDRRIAIGMLCLVAGAAVLSWPEQLTFAGILGPLAIIGACIAWGLDNNFTRKVSLADPLQIVEIKGLVAGPINLLIGLWAGGQLPNLTAALTAGVVGFFGYGVSLVLFVVALRDLGAARTGAYFSTAPFLGTLAAVGMFAEPVTVQLVAAGGLMAFGVWLHLTERHEHVHTHEPMAHAHAHRHDEHHRHAHGPDDPPGEPHTHRHEHDRLTHTHPHVPDMHHRHTH
ncbi:MAG: DMT family transporter [Pseudolabrys sp.]|nr:DMT family transporter [Pseudolabrys sp.]MSP32060.1 DMT family transporter [Pseudolabrys sp.]